MRIMLITMTALALVACKKAEVAPNADATTNDVAMANDAMAGNDAMATNATAAAATSLNSSTYEYVRKSRGMQMSVDATGNYITTAGKDHMDHGTVVTKDGKLCFTSAMTKDGEICWTDPKLAEGASGETVSDKGEKLTIKRVAYIAKKM